MKATPVCELEDLRWIKSDGVWHLHGVVTIENKSDSVIWYFRNDVTAFRLEVTPSDRPGENGSVLELDLSLDQFPDSLVADAHELLPLLPGEELRIPTSWLLRLDAGGTWFRLGAFAVTPGTEVRVQVADFPVMDAFAFKGEKVGEFVDFTPLSAQPRTAFVVELISNWQYIRLPSDLSSGLVAPKH